MTLFTGIVGRSEIGDKQCAHDSPGPEEQRSASENHSIGGHGGDSAQEIFRQVLL